MTLLYLKSQDVLTACHHVVRRVMPAPLNPWAFWSISCVLQLLPACYGIQCTVQEEVVLSKGREEGGNCTVQCNPGVGNNMLWKITLNGR